MTQHRESDGDKVVIRSAPIQQGALITIIIFLVGQTFGWGWWAATTTERLRSMGQDVSSMKVFIIDYSKTKSDLDALRYAFNEVKEKGSPITDRRLTVLEYKTRDLQAK